MYLGMYFSVEVFSVLGKRFQSGSLFSADTRRFVWYRDDATIVRLVAL